MDTKTQLLAVEQKAYSDDEKATWRIISSALLSDDQDSQKVSKITDDLRLFVGVPESGGVWWALWGVFIHIISAIPPDHPWQIVLVQVVDKLSHLDGPFGRSPKNNHLQWKVLPRFAASFRERYVDPTDVWILKEFRLEEDVYTWKNYTSFAARVSGLKVCQWVTFPVWQLRSDLEHDFPTEEQAPYRPTVIELRLWTATEWLLKYGEAIYEIMNGPEADKDDQRIFRLGPLLKDVPVFSVARWNFWKERLLKHAAELDTLGVDSAMAERIDSAVKHMGEIEERYEKQVRRKTRKHAKQQAKSQAKRRAARHSRKRERR